MVFEGFVEGNSNFISHVSKLGISVSKNLVYSQWPLNFLISYTRARGLGWAWAWNWNWIGWRSLIWKP